MTTQLINIPKTLSFFNGAVSTAAPIESFDIIDFEVDYMEQQIVITGYEETKRVSFDKFEKYAEKHQLIGDFAHDTMQGGSHHQEEWSVGLTEFLEEHLEYSHLKNYMSAL